MLKNTFCHVPGIGIKKEGDLWSSGFCSWDTLFEKSKGRPLKTSHIYRYIERSMRNLENENPRYFSGLLPSGQLWRLFPEFRHTAAYLDIETTGMGGPNDYITTISVYDGKRIYCYVKGDNLDDFKRDIKKYKVIVTYNGKCFDIPFIERYLKVRMDQTHIDLRFLLSGLGYRGGLKGCEKKLGINRKELDGIDGYFAVLLWNDYLRNRNQKTLETLLAYNIEDVVNLETLMVISYNLRLKETPFSRSHKLLAPKSPKLPYRADAETIERILNDNCWHLLI